MEGLKYICKFHRKTLMLESLFNKVTGLHAGNIIKKRLLQKCLPVYIAKFLRTPILKSICKRQLVTSTLKQDHDCLAAPFHLPKLHFFIRRNKYSVNEAICEHLRITSSERTSLSPFSKIVRVNLV